MSTPPFSTKSSPFSPKPKKFSRTRGSVSLICDKPWDGSITSGSLVVLTSDFPTMNVWRVFRLTNRILYPEDIFNYPGIGDRGMRQGDPYCPLAHLRMYRSAPGFVRVGHGAEEKIVDSYLLEKILPHDLDPLIANLTALKKEVS